jgi:hypothetical protein
MIILHDLKSWQSPRSLTPPHPFFVFKASLSSPCLPWPRCLICWWDSPSNSDKDPVPIYFQLYGNLKPIFLINRFVAVDSFVYILHIQFLLLKMIPLLSLCIMCLLQDLRLLTSKIWLLKLKSFRARHYQKM